MCAGEDSTTLRWSSPRPGARGKKSSGDATAAAAVPGVNWHIVSTGAVLYRNHVRAFDPAQFNPGQG